MDRPSAWSSRSRCVQDNHTAQSYAFDKCLAPQTNDANPGFPSFQHTPAWRMF